jgi:hypothetical protein
LPSTGDPGITHQPRFERPLATPARLTLFDVAVLEHLDAILAVPGIDLYSIGPNDFAQSLGYPGQLDHPEVVKAKRTQPQWPVHR